MRGSHAQWTHEGAKIKRGGVGGRVEEEGQIRQEETREN
jgi:hypothetical protein